MSKTLKSAGSIAVAIVLFFSFIHSAYAVHVNGYYRKNGTYVQSYERTAPDGNPYNNYGYPGNYNPNTGRITGGSADAYLNRYYGSSGSGYSASSYDSYSSYSTPTIPTCPANSYYDGISSCKCNYGYAVSGSSCVPKDSLCHSQLGYGSSYDPIGGNCKCDYNYIIGSSGQCEPASLVCSQKIGTMSQYNSSTNTCECMYGYTFDGTSCVYKTSTYSSSSAHDTSGCPVNSHTSLTDNSKCTCDAGYQVNSTKTACVVAPKVTSQVTCPAGYTCTPAY